MSCYVSQSTNVFSVKRQALMPNDNNNTKVIYDLPGTLFLNTVIGKAYKTMVQVNNKNIGTTSVTCCYS